MPHFAFPLSADGWVIQVMFGLNGPDIATLVHAGQPIPAPVQVRALLDNGSDTTAIAAHVIRRLGLGSAIPGVPITASGPVPVNIYRASLTVAGPAGIIGPVLVMPNLVVSGLTAPLPNIDALIGMNVLRECLLVLDGPASSSSLGFEPKEYQAMKIEDLDRLPTIHYTEMPEWPADDPIYRDAQTFRRELPRLLAEGNEGKWVLIKGAEVIGLYATFDESYHAGLERYLMQPFICQPVREWQPLFRMPTYLARVKIYPPSAAASSSST